MQIIHILLSLLFILCQVPLYADIHSTSLKACPKDTESSYHNCYARYRFDDATIYEGGWKNDERHGYGLEKYSNGDVFVGNHKKDQRHGFGAYIYSDGSKEIGFFKNSKLNGYALELSGENKILDAGIWRNDELIAKSNLQNCKPNWARFHKCYGKYVYDDGDEYIGEWVDDYPDGFGILSYKGGDVYIGEFKEGGIHGYGLIISDNYISIGSFHEHRFHGHFAKIYRNSIQLDFYENDNHIEEVEDYSWLTLIDQSPKSDNQDLIAAASGTGFPITLDGLILTNSHVVEGCNEVYIIEDGKEYRMNVISTDNINDLALLKGEYDPDFIFTLSETNPNLVDDIYVAGYPFGKSLGSSTVKVTRGVVSSLAGIGNDFSNIQIDAAVQPGNSGGPIMNKNGEVVAVAVSKLDLDYALENFGVIPENTNFGIKVSTVRTFLEGNNVSLDQKKSSNVRVLSDIVDEVAYISCKMTQAQIDKMKTTKVLFYNQ